ncbi:MAG: PD40 domain-containing protein [Bryobacterales bacterium]|nr:PD40 domain-containing protein [Bryobacterales bacterium]
MSFRDSRTGARIHRYTSAPAISHPTYFLQSSFTNGNRQLLFTSYRTGSAQLFEASLPEGEIRQLTDGRAIHPFSASIHPDGETVFFVRGGEVWGLSLRDLREWKIFGLDGAQFGEASPDRKGEWITCAVKHQGQNGLAVGRANGEDWRVIPFPRTIIHPQFHPLDPEWLEFAADPAPRMFRVRRDGAGMECLHEHGNDVFVVHETFLGDTGDLVFTIWPGQLCRMRWDEPREVETIARFNAWHITPNRAGSRILCDTNHPDEGIHEVNVSTGERVLLCESLASSQGSQWKRSRYALAEDFAEARRRAEVQGGGVDGAALSWMEVSTDTVYGPQWTHPHPSYSPDETKIAFASDRDGVTQVYVAELETHPQWATLRED